MLPRGTTFIRDGHVWFNISEPTTANQQVLCVNLTSLDEDCPDDECLIACAEYSWVDDRHPTPTAVAFSRARLWDAQKLIMCLKKGILKKPRQGDIPKTTVAKIVKLAVNSRELSEELKAFL